MASLMERLGVNLPIVQAPMAGVSDAGHGGRRDQRGRPRLDRRGRDGCGGRAGHDRRSSRPDLGTVQRERLLPPTRDGGPGPGARLARRARSPCSSAMARARPRRSSEIYTSFVADEAMVELLVETRPAVVSFHFGLPSAQTIARLKAAGIVLFSTATNLDEAEQAVAAGVDAIVAQGYEAGGHRGVFDPQAPDAQLGVLALTRLLVSRIPLPVIAAGGIMDGAGIAAALDLGAELAQLGTAFVACPESSARTNSIARRCRIRARR